MSEVVAVDKTEVENKLLIEGIFLKYGYDFRHYAMASLYRRINSVVAKFECKDALELLAFILGDEVSFRKVLPFLTVGTSEMFRDPLFFRALRDLVVPVLKTYPTVNIWVAGCSTGEEIFSLAILLKEEAIYEKCVIFATDINPRALSAAQEGIYSAELMQVNTRNYAEASGIKSFSSYYTSGYGFAKMNADLLTNVVFSEHNLVTDHVFTECNLILCRNVLIYFDAVLQNRVLDLFTDALPHGGILCLGSKESIRFSSVVKSYAAISAREKIYRRSGFQKTLGVING